MRSTNVADLKNRLSSFLREVQNGEEVIVTSRGQSVARLIPFALDNGLSEHERKMVREGRMTLPAKKFDPVSFNKRALPKATGSIVEALLDDRADRF